MVNKIEKPSRERRLLSGGLVALTVAWHWSRPCFTRNRLSGLIGGSQPSQHLIAGLCAIPPTRAIVPHNKEA